MGGLLSLDVFILKQEGPDVGHSCGDFQEGLPRQMNHGAAEREVNATTGADSHAPREAMFRVVH